MNKSGKNNGWIWFAVIVLGFWLVNSGNLDLSGLGFGGGTDTPAAAYCADPSVTMTVGPVTKAFTTTAVATDANLYFKNGVYQDTLAAGDTKTVAAGDKVQMYYLVGDATYFANKGTSITVPCGPFSTGDFDGNAVNVQDNAVLTFYQFNGDTGNDNNGGVDNETIGTSETGKWTLKFDAPAEDQVGSRGGKVILVIDYDKNNFTAADWTLSGWTKDNGMVPSAHSSLGTSYATTSFWINSCIPAANGVCSLGGDLLATAKAVNPDGSFNMTVYYEDWIRNPDNANEMLFAVEDVDGTLASSLGGSELVYFT